MEKLLSIKDFSVTYRNKEKSVYAVRNVNLDIYKGDALGIVGESGSGKSTLVMAILRLLPESTATVTGNAYFRGQDLMALTQKEMNGLRWKDIAIVFQKAMNSFSPVHRIGKSLMDIYRVHYPKADKKELFARTEETLRLVNLGNRVLRMYPHQLSGGMMQRVAIAVALLHEPSLLVMDEATTALDVVTQGQILEEIKEMEDRLNTTRIMITHDMSVVAASCNRVAVMYAGVLVEVGPVKQIFKNPKHPYTMGLLGSFPSLEGEIKELSPIPGHLPDLSQLQEGCIFAPRCPMATERCRKEAPRLREISNDHQAACHFAGGESNE